MENNIKRMWVNQPSTLQVLHKIHGTNVLADFNDTDDIDPTVTVYLLSGDVKSLIVPKLCLSKGWNIQ